jgi:hypothetical protein
MLRLQKREVGVAMWFRAYVDIPVQFVIVSDLDTRRRCGISRLRRAGPQAKEQEN